MASLNKPSVFHYNESYFYANSLTNGKALKVSFKDAPPEAVGYCIDTLWRSKWDLKDKVGFQEVSDQPYCTSTLIEYDVGMPFTLYKWYADD